MPPMPRRERSSHVTRPAGDVPVRLETEAGTGPILPKGTVAR